jgi:adenosine kinase
LVSPGCGDAFRSGFLHGFSRGWDFLSCAKLGTVMGSFAIEQHGGQNHAPSSEQIKARYEGEFGKWPATEPRPAIAKHRA